MFTGRILAPVVALSLLIGVGTAQAQQKALTIEAIFDPDARVDFNGSPPTDLTWMDESHYVWSKRADNGRGRVWMKVDATTGRAEPLFDATRMETALAELPGISREEATALSYGRLTLNPTHTGALLTISGDLYFYDFKANRATRLTAGVGDEEEATFSPDGRLVAFVRGNNLFFVDVDTQRERAVTTDGGPEILNGKLDWLYQEEIYGRGTFRAYWWSPDSSRVAFLRLDERPVPGYTVVDQIPRRPIVEATDYPKSGDPNPTVQLGVARVAGSDPQWVDTSVYAAVEFLIVNVAWTPDSRQLVYQVQNREQTWLDLNVAAVGALPRTVIRETTKAWVNENGNPVWLKDGTFLWISERSGFRHVYHYRPDGSEIRQVTSGRWDVRTLYGIDQPRGWIYFAGSEHSAIGRDLYRIRLDGSGQTRLSRAEGTHRATFDPTFARYIGFWSDVSHPTQVRLHRADGSEQRVIDANPVPALAAYGLLQPEFLQVKTRDGFVMEAMMIKPRAFDPSRRYPVYQHTYAGPGYQQAVNAWRGPDEHLFFQLLAQNGIIVWVCDNRSASGKGVESQWPIYGSLGELELQDIEDGVAWLRRQSYVDASRIVLSGWSYGGFMTGYALTHSTSFAAGIIGAPVTDWRNYDSVYTERYMRMPQNNPEGYERTSVTKAAGNLHGQALLIHGTTDDNVHFQNTVQLVYELQNAGKTFEVMIYPASRHGVTGPRLHKHLRQLMFDFVMRTVRMPPPAGTTTAR